MYGYNETQNIRFFIGSTRHSPCEPVKRVKCHNRSMICTTQCGVSILFKEVTASEEADNRFNLGCDPGNVITRRLKSIDSQGNEYFLETTSMKGDYEFGKIDSSNGYVDERI